MTALLKNRYRILRRLNSGGFGETFLAEDTDMPSARRCVIKKLIPITDDPQAYQLVKERFQREAAILEKLGEGNSQIPSLYAYFEEAGQFYLVQEWIEGVTLVEKVEQEGVLTESSVREILIGTLSILDFVHSQNIIHRDIKPDNIILRASNNQPVSIDFGAIKETMEASGGNSRSIIIGTPGFMSSEQSIGRPVYASDIYSLGLTAIYLLTGKCPQLFTTNSRTGEINWRQYTCGVSSAFADILDKAIQSHPRDRFSDAKAMSDAIQNLTTPIGFNFYHSAPSPTRAIVPPTQLETNTKHSKNWQKAFITSGIIGAFVMGALLLNNYFLSFSHSQTISSRSSSQEREPSQESSRSQNNTVIQQRPSPVDFTVAHYQAIRDRNYEQTWSHLSDRFKQTAISYTDYKSWWNKVSDIKIVDIKLIEENSDFATVDLKLQYFMNSGEIVEDPKTILYLVWSQESSNWSVDSKRASSDASFKSVTKTIDSLSWRESCGSLDLNNRTWYRVVGNPQAYEAVRNNYCGDVLIVRGNLQAASFNSQSEAEDFAITLNHATGYEFWVEVFRK